ncbi:hypothetical protein VPH35_041643 [Triticum aestivum]|uniref:uncharacterized protein n=1 Tax=Triticum aestivum TaxID=4565 RepID=UPI0008426A9A|nr:uncharacterized protein LOC123056202 [Triticum aestivum]
MTIVELQVHGWQKRGIQVMVLLSFAMQLVLLVLAEFRRRIDSGVLRAFIWSAFILADSIAIYTLGHLSVTSRSEDHELMAFWAPFLLIHLGGQDNITAYAIEDNRLWLRHLQVLVVQVAAAAYVLYESVVVGTHARIWNAAALIFMVGVIKYGERVWALKRAGTSASGHTYQTFDNRTDSSEGPPTDWGDTEGLLRIAHLLLDIPKDLLQGPLPRIVVHLGQYKHPIPSDKLLKVVEMQLSLMHDVVYSKAEVMHTWYGLCIRVISPVFIVIAFVLFHRSDLSAGDHHHSRADIVITYVLLGGAVTLEMVSVLRAMFSRWPTVILGKLSYDEVRGKRMRMWGLLAHAIASIRRFVLPKRDDSRWWWSNSMGQHNLIDLCVHSRASQGSRIASWMWIEDWWNKMVYSSSITVSTTIKDLVVKQVLESEPSPYEVGYSRAKEEGLDHITNSRGRAALINWPHLGIKLERVMVDLDKSILMWHIATDIYLRTHRDLWSKDDDVRRLAEAIKAMSDYIVFLLAARPHMLPDSVGRTKYVEMCYCLTGLRYSTTRELTSRLLDLSTKQSPDYFTSVNMVNIADTQKVQHIRDNETLAAACELARELSVAKLGQPTDVLKMLAEVWTEMLCYTGYRCSGYSHAKQLSNGGELLTVAALVVEYFRSYVLKHVSNHESDQLQEP